MKFYEKPADRKNYNDSFIKSDGRKIKSYFLKFYQDVRKVNKKLAQVGFIKGRDYTNSFSDEYDCSIEYEGVPNDFRMSPEQIKVVYDLRFSKIYLNHVDKWQTHYSGKSVRGWRRKETETGGFLISYWPEGWTSARCKEWLEIGYMTIVPDSLDNHKD